jgi:DHA1 family multidrug resistance protein-like MFS transporter
MPVSSPSWILFLLSASVGVATIGLGIIWPLVPVYAVELGAGGLQVGMIIASFNLARTIFNPLSGRLSDRYGRKPFITTGLLLYALVSVFYVMAARVETLILVRLLHGLTSVLVAPVAMALVADIAPKHRMGFYLGTQNMAVMLGLGAGPVAGGIIRDFFGMHMAFYAMGGLALLTFLGVTTFVPGDRQRERDQSRQPPAPFKSLLKNRVILGLLLLRFFLAAGQGSVYTFLPLFGLQIHLTSAQVGIILGANIFLIAFLQRLCGGLADRINPLYMIIAGSLISGIAVWGIPLGEGFVMVLSCNILMGIGNGISMPGGLVLTGRVGKLLGMGSTMGLTDTGWSLGMIVSPIISGVIMDSLGLSSIFVAGGILIIIGTVLIAVILKGYGKDASPATGGNLDID